MEAKKVVIEGGGSNLFKVSYHSGYYYAFKVKVGFITDDLNEIGKASSLDDALRIIRAYSGKNIKEVSSW